MRTIKFNTFDYILCNKKKKKIFKLGYNNGYIENKINDSFWF